MVKFTKIARITVIIAFSQGARGAKNRKNQFFQTDSKWLKICFLGVFGRPGGFLSLKIHIIALSGLGNGLERLKWEIDLAILLGIWGRKSSKIDFFKMMPKAPKCVFSAFLGFSSTPKEHHRAEISYSSPNLELCGFQWAKSRQKVMFF